MPRALLLLALSAPLRAADWAATSDALERFPVLAGLEQTQGNLLGFGGEVFRFHLAQHGAGGRFFVIEKVGDPADPAAALARDWEALLDAARSRNAPSGAAGCRSHGTRPREPAEGPAAVLDDFRCEVAGRQTPRPIVLYASAAGLFAAVGGGVSLEAAAAAVYAGGPAPASWKAAAVRAASPPGRLRLPDGGLELLKPAGFELSPDGMRGPRVLLALSDARRRLLRIDKLREDPEGEGPEPGPELLAGAARGLAADAAPGEDCEAEEPEELEAPAGWTSYGAELDCPRLAQAGLERSALAVFAQEGAVYRAVGFGLPLAELTGFLAGATEPGAGSAAPEEGGSGWLLWLLPAVALLAVGARQLKRRRARLA